MFFAKRSTYFYCVVFLLLSYFSGAVLGSNVDPIRDETIPLSVQVIVREGQRQTFLHGADVLIEPLYFVGMSSVVFPVISTTGNGGLADMGALPSSQLVGDYRVLVSHGECGHIEKRDFSLDENARPQTLSLTFTGPCSSRPSEKNKHVIK